MAGTINLSLQQQFDSRGLPLGGGKLYCFQSGTSTPQSAFKDIALTLAHENPIELDASGRVPQVFFADGTIKLRLTNSGGTIVVFEADFLPVLGASSGGSGGSSVDATTVLATGDLKHRYGTGSLNGFVRANGLTIGSATSGATERANSDCQALFEYLWTNDTSLSVSGGRGASANADWSANKKLTLPDMRGRTLAGMDDMGSATATRIHTILASTTLGGAGGNQLYGIAQANLPAVAASGSVLFSSTGTSSYTPAGGVTFSSSGNNIYTPTGSVGSLISGNGANVVYTDPSHAHSYLAPGADTFVGTSGAAAAVAGPRGSISTGAQSTGIVIPVNNIASLLSLTTPTLTGTPVTVTFGGTAVTASFAGANLGSGVPISIASPMMVVTIYIKL